MGRHGRHVARLGARAAPAIPQGVFPSVDQTVVTADRALPCDVPGCTIKFGDDVTQATSATGTPAARDIGVPITVRQVVGDPRDDRSEKDREVKHRRRQSVGEVASLVVQLSWVTVLGMTTNTCCSSSAVDGGRTHEDDNR